MVDETSKIIASPGPATDMGDSAKPTPFAKVGPPNVTQEDKSLLVEAVPDSGNDSERAEGAEEKKDEVIEDEMIKSEEQNEPVQANE